jgi:ankyrin repeat protein
MKSDAPHVAHVVLVGDDLQARDSDGLTSLHWAVRNGQASIVNLLLRAGAHVESKDTAGNTALHHAAMIGHVGIARVLLDAGADVSTRDVTGRTPLHLAATFGHAELITLLVDARALVDAIAYDHSTPLHLAAKNGHEDATLCLLRAGVDHLNYRVGRIRATRCAYWSGNLRVLRILKAAHRQSAPSFYPVDHVARGADLDRVGYTAANDNLFTSPTYMAALRGDRSFRGLSPWKFGERG